jgi:polysaccharide biosynthesis/export protein
MRYRIFLLFSLVLMLTSCDKYLNRSFMLRTDKNYVYSEFDGLEAVEYRISPNDIIGVRVYANNGFQMINITGAATGITEGSATLQLKVEFDGFVKLPIIGRIYIAGLTSRQAEMLLEDRFVEYLNKPFVLLEVSNKRVTIFAGGNTSVVPLENDNTTLFEVLAKSGGIPENGKADRIKLIRGDLKNPEVFLIDLSTLQGVRNADLVLQANDIIYIELRKEYVTKLFERITPYLAAITTLTTVFILVDRFAR